MSTRLYEKEVAITGIGQSEVGRPSQLSGMRLTVDACLQAIADAGLERGDIDGIACWPGDNNNGDSIPTSFHNLASTIVHNTRPRSASRDFSLRENA